jgi:hypothetical protein
MKAKRDAANKAENDKENAGANEEGGGDILGDQEDADVIF